VHDSHAQLESLQAALTVKRASEIAQRYGEVDMLLVRHVLEHAHLPREFLRACAALVKADGYLVFEVPAAEKTFGAADHSFLWEEHVTYFTGRTLDRFFASAGMQVRLHRYPYTLEDSLIAVVRKADLEDSVSQPVMTEFDMGRNLRDRLVELRAEYQQELRAERAKRRGIALFGAGHLALKFVNFYGLAPWIDCAIDDNPHKRGRFLPGSRLPIEASSVLDSGAIHLCLLAVNPDREAALIESRSQFVARGGAFRSIFRLSTIGLSPCRTLNV
jgi:hypothetical protein